MALFDVLSVHRCRTPLNWIESGEKVIFGPEIINEAEAMVCRIQDNLKAARSHQESYANKRCRPLKFEVGDHIYLWVSLMKGVKRLRFHLRGEGCDTPSVNVAAKVFYSCRCFLH
jgi:hypothetical protein